MLHYVCDRCQRSMDPDEGPRYVIHIDVDVVHQDGESIEPIQGDEATDYLADLNETLQAQSLDGVHSDGVHSAYGTVPEDEEALDYLNEVLSRGEGCEFGESDHPEGNQMFSGELESFVEGGVSSKLESTPTSFDLCPDCYGKYTQDPLSRDRALKLHFSNN